MIPGLVVLIALVLGATAWLWWGHWRARTAVMAGQPTSTREVTACALSGGILLAQFAAPMLVGAVAWSAGVVGLDTAGWSPATVSAAFVGVVGTAGYDAGWRGMVRGPRLLPRLRHAPIAVLLPTFLIAGWPLLAQATIDAGSAVGGVTPPALCSAAVGPDGSVAGYGPDRLANAAVIVQVGHEMGVPERGRWIAVAAAMQESSLRDLNYGDRDSLGLYQQRPSQGWGSPAQVTDPVYASRKFYEALLAIPGWAGLPLWQAAQAVQRSGHPTAYSKHEATAAEVIGAVTATTCRS